MTNTVFLLLGSNLGDRAGNIKTAIAHLQKFCRLVDVSSIYFTEAWGKTDQPGFYNQVIKITTELQPDALLRQILAVELEMGRQRLERWGARLIDIDILLFNDQVIQTETLTVPHPQMPFRKFTLAPLNEIAPDVNHPVLNKSITILLRECQDPLEVRRINDAEAG